MAINGINNSNLYSKFSNIDYNSDKEYLKEIVRLSDFEPIRTPEEKKKRKIFKYSTIFAGILTGLGLGFTLLKGKGKKIDYTKLSQQLKDSFKSLNLKDKFRFAFENIINMKDDIWDKLVSHKGFKPVRAVGDWITNIYKKGARIATRSEYEAALKKVNSLKGGENIQIETFDKWFDTLSSDLYKALHIKNNRVTDNMFEDGMKGFSKRFLSYNIADTKIADVAKKHMQEIPIDTKWSKELQEAVKNFNAVKNKTSQNLIPKLRDIECGSAPTDLLTMVASTGAFGVALLTAEDKEERKSMLLNLGIPLVTTFASTSYATYKLLSGMKGLIFGLATGEIAKIGASTIDKQLSKKGKEKEILA